MSVRFALLGLLSQKPRHGYELHRLFTALVGGVGSWELKPAQVYTTLERLEEAGLVERTSDLGQGENPERRIYSLTAAGQAELQAWFDAGVTPDHQRDEFFVKLMVALAGGLADPHEVIQVQRVHLYQELHAATALRDGYDPRNHLAQILLLDKAIMHLEADLRWLDITEVRLEEMRHQPPPEPILRRRGRPPRGDKGSTHPPPGPKERGERPIPS